MRPEERIWWEELADQYEEWAEKPPQFYSYLDGGYIEQYTCLALEEGFGFDGCHNQPHKYLQNLWRHSHKRTIYPAGERWRHDRPERRFDFCHWMAETIREYLETGKGPWEVE